MDCFTTSTNHNYLKTLSSLDLHIDFVPGIGTFWCKSELGILSTMELGCVILRKIKQFLEIFQYKTNQDFQHNMRKNIWYIFLNYRKRKGVVM